MKQLWSKNVLQLSFQDIILHEFEKYLRNECFGSYFGELIKVSFVNCIFDDCCSIFLPLHEKYEERISALHKVFNEARVRNISNFHSQGGHPPFD